MPDDVRAMLDELERMEKAARESGGFDDYLAYRDAMARDGATLLRLARRAGEMEEVAREVLSAAHLRTHGFPEGDISDLDFSKMLPAIVRLDAALTPQPGEKEEDR